LNCDVLENNGTFIQFLCDDFTRCKNCQVDMLLKNLDDEDDDIKSFEFFGETLSNITGQFELDSTTCGRFRLIANIKTNNYVDEKEIGLLDSKHKKLFLKLLIKNI